MFAQRVAAAPDVMTGRHVVYLEIGGEGKGAFLGCEVSHSWTVYVGDAHVEQPIRAEALTWRGRQWREPWARCVLVRFQVVGDCGAQWLDVAGTGGFLTRPCSGHLTMDGLYSDEVCSHLDGRAAP